MNIYESLTRRPTRLEAFCRWDQHRIRVCHSPTAKRKPLHQALSTGAPSKPMMSSQDSSISLEDGLTPLLSRQDRHEFKLPRRKLIVLGVLLGCSVLVDAGICSFCCTGGFGADWWRRLGTLRRFCHAFSLVCQSAWCVLCSINRNANILPCLYEYA